MSGRPDLSINQSLLDEIWNDPFLKNLLSQRGCQDMEKARSFLCPEFYQPAKSEEFPEMEKAVIRINHAIERDEQIGIWGDFDADGQTSTSILYEGLTRLGARAIYHIPVRSEESHGITLPVLKKFLPQIQLLLTCDTGISAHNAIEYASSKNIDTIITDHHIPIGVAPNCFAVINPHYLPENHPLSYLSGVGVAYKLIEALYKKFSRIDETESFLDLVALGLIADLVPLIDDNRYLVQRGLRKIREGSRPGLNAILKLAGVNIEGIDEETVSFIIAPRLNAAGRLSDASFTVELLTTQDQLKADSLALKLEGLNEHRKLLSQQVLSAARSEIEKDQSVCQKPCIVLSHPLWPAGVLGIAASHLVEMYHKPVILISSPPNQDARGSARSIPGVNITEVLYSARNLLINFGGHPMAAGFSLSTDNIQAFKNVMSHPSRDLFKTPLVSDENMPVAQLDFEKISLEFVEKLELLSPFGVQNPSPLFISKKVKIIDSVVIGKGKEHVIFSLTTPQGLSQKVIRWQGAGMEVPDNFFDLVYLLRSRTFQGKKEIQIEWIEASISELPTINNIEKVKVIKVTDHRNLVDPFLSLSSLPQEPNLSIWYEGDRKLNHLVFNRYSIPPSRILAIFTIPPSRSVLNQVLSRVNPELVYLYAPAMPIYTVKSFLTTMAGLIRYAINHKSGTTTISDLACACILTESIIEQGIAWLEASGQISCQRIDSSLALSYADNLASAAMKSIEKDIGLVLAEIAAFRDYYLRAQPENLIRR